MASMTVTRLADGLWRWSAPHPEWVEGATWDATVWSTYVECPDATVVIDPCVPADGGEATRFWRAFDADVARRGVPVVVALTCGWHLRSAEAFIARHAATVWCPDGGRDGVDAHTVRDGDAPTAGVVARDLQAPPEAREFVYLLTAHRAVAVGDVLVGGETLALAPASWYREPDLERWYTTRARSRLNEVVPTRFTTWLPGHGAAVTHARLPA